MMTEPRYMATLDVAPEETCARCGLPGPHRHPELNTHLRPGPSLSITMAPGQVRHLLRLVRNHRKRVSRDASKDKARGFVPEVGHLDANLAAIELDGALESLLIWNMEQAGFDPDKARPEKAL